MPLNRYSIALAAALVTAGVATFGVFRVIENTRTQNQVVMRPIVVAELDVPEGAALTRSALVVSQWPAAAVPPGAFATLDSVVGRVTRVNVYKGEAIVPGRLAPAGTGQGLQVKITPGKRAMAVRIDDVAGVSGLIQPDSRVDVLVTLRDQEGGGEQISKLFMSNMRVLSVGTIDRSGPDNRPIQATTATLEVTPFEAERLAVAMRDGTIQLVLRGYGDPDSINTKGARSEDVLSRPPRPVVAPSSAPAPRRMSRPSAATPTPTIAPPPAPVVVPKPPDSLAVQVIRGDKVTQQKFDTVRKKPPV
jgi:pilus assembly protein CpaB